MQATILVASADAAAGQVVAEAMGMAVPHSALAPSGQPVWLDIATRSAEAVVAMKQNRVSLKDILTPAALRNGMALHAAFGGSTNLLLHIPAIAHCAGIDFLPGDNPVVEAGHDVAGAGGGATCASPYVFMSRHQASSSLAWSTGAARLAVRCDGRQASAPVAMMIIRIVCRSLFARLAPRCGGVRHRAERSRQRCSPVLRAFHRESCAVV